LGFEVWGGGGELGDGWMDGWMDGGMEGWVDGWMDGVWDGVDKRGGGGRLL